MQIIHSANCNQEIGTGLIAYKINIVIIKSAKLYKAVSTVCVLTQYILDKQPQLHEAILY